MPNEMSLVSLGFVFSPRTLQVQSLDQEDPLEKRKATHSSILVWRIPWTEGPGGPRPLGHKKSDMTEQLTNMFTFSSGHYIKLFQIFPPKDRVLTISFILPQPANSKTFKKKSILPMCSIKHLSFQHLPRGNAKWGRCSGKGRVSLTRRTAYRQSSGIPTSPFPSGPEQWSPRALPHGWCGPLILSLMLRPPTSTPHQLSIPQSCCIHPVSFLVG